MKQVVIIDESPPFREYLRIKLAENGVDVSAAINGLDGITKIRNTNPDLVIMNYNLSRQGCMEVLKQKKASPTLALIPVIIIAQQLDQEKIIELVPYNVKKVFTKPVKIDALFAALAELLSVSFEIDESPGIVEVHVNDDIIFVEITEGLNRDKLDLLRFKITELIELYQIRVPKLIIMISGLTLNFADGPNLQKLLDNVLASSGVRQKNIRILTMDGFTKTFVKSQKEYEDIEVVSKLQYALDGLLAELDSAEGEKEAALIGSRVLSAEKSAGESVQLRFDGENKFSNKFSLEEIKESLLDLHIAAVDDDSIIRELISNTFRGFSVKISPYADGAEFIAALERERFDLVFLDLMMPRADGFAVLRELKDRNIAVPVIILSAANQRETVIRAFQMGTKSYLMKPLKAEDIFKKTLEILRVNF
jgi:DNA-binding response OmpR family regulator